MTSQETTQARKWANLQRRVLNFRKHYGMKWTRRQTHELIQRLMYASDTEGVDDVDLRTLVRLYNREILGKANEQTSE